LQHYFLGVLYSCMLTSLISYFSPSSTLPTDTEISPD
jgi:hypothetical protein